MAKLWCFNDAHDWGKSLHEIATRRGHDAHLFEDPRSPDDGFVFMHMNHHPSVRMLHKRVMSILAMNPDLKLIPDYRASNLYDDKLEQARQLSKWMPRTQVFYTPGATRRYLDKHPALPFMSKSLDGASGHNVRYITTFEEAKQEIRMAFSDIGIKCQHGQSQRGYLMWQDFIPGNEGDIRIAAIGSKRLIMRRSNRMDKPVSSNSGKLTPIVSLAEAEIMGALATANSFFAGEKVKWGCVDMIRDEQGRWYVLELSVSWTLHRFYDCAFIDCAGDDLSGCPRIMYHDVHATPASGIQQAIDKAMSAENMRRGNDIWNILVSEIEAGAF